MPTPLVWLYRGEHRASVSNLVFYAHSASMVTSGRKTGGAHVIARQASPTLSNSSSLMFVFVVLSTSFLPQGSQTVNQTCECDSTICVSSRYKLSS